MTTPAATIGNVEIPTTQGHSLTGGLVENLLGFAEAVIKSDVAAAWADVCPGLPVIKATCAWDPEEADIAVPRLPALFCYTTEFIPKGIDVVTISEQRVALLWVAPGVDQGRMAKRRGIFSLIGACLNRAINDGRHTSFIAPGDANPKAATWGSSLYECCGVTSIRMVTSDPAKVQLSDGMTPLDGCLTIVAVTQATKDYIAGNPAASIRTAVTSGNWTTTTEQP